MSHRVPSRAEPDRLPPSPFAHLLFLGFETGDLGDSSWERIDAVAERRTLLAEDAPHLGAALASADGLLLKPWLGADRALIDAAPGLRYIGMLGTGMGRIDARHAAARGIAIRNVAGDSTRGVSEFVLAVVLAHLRDLERRLATPSFTFVLDHPGGLAPHELARLARRPNCVVYPSLGDTTVEASAAKEELFVRAIEEQAAGAAAGPAG